MLLILRLRRPLPGAHGAHHDMRTCHLKEAFRQKSVMEEATVVALHSLPRALSRHGEKASQHIIFHRLQNPMKLPMDTSIRTAGDTSHPSRRRNRPNGQGCYRHLQSLPLALALIVRQPTRQGYQARAPSLAVRRVLGLICHSAIHRSNRPQEAPKDEEARKLLRTKRVDADISIHHRQIHTRTRSPDGSLGRGTKIAL